MSSWTAQAGEVRELWGIAAAQSDSIQVHLWDDPRQAGRSVRPPTVADHIAPTTFMKTPWLLKLISVRSSEKFVKLYPSPAFTCLPKWR
jgi:hypothetical protein